MENVNVLFLNNKAMRETGAADMEAVIHDVERVYARLYWWRIRYGRYQMDRLRPHELQEGTSQSKCYGYTQ